MKHSFKILVMVGVGSVAACATETTEEHDTSVDDVTGVVDFAAVEGAIGLTADTKDASGAWRRSQARIEDGTCYKELEQGPKADTYEMRRYVEGTAFFKKKSASVAGDNRPILCVDVDLKDAPTGAPLQLHPADLDMIMRYGLGRPLAVQADGVDSVTIFDHGRATYRTATGPLASWRPSVGAGRFLEALTLQRDGAEVTLDGTLVTAVFKQNWRTSDFFHVFSLSSDVQGEFLGVEAWSTSEPIGIKNMVVRYSRADAVSNGDADGHWITVLAAKFELDGVTPNASCDLPGGAQVGENADFECAFDLP